MTIAIITHDIYLGIKHLMSMVDIGTCNVRYEKGNKLECHDGPMRYVVMKPNKNARGYKFNKAFVHKDVCDDCINKIVKPALIREPMELIRWE